MTLLDEHGIAGALLVQPCFLGADNRFLLACLRRHPDRFRAVVVLNGPHDLAPLSIDGVGGIRLNLIGRAVPELTAPAWRHLGAELARRGQHLEVQARDEQWTALAPALRHWPSPVVFDHLGLSSPKPDPTGCSGAATGPGPPRARPNLFRVPHLAGRPRRPANSARRRRPQRGQAPALVAGTAPRRDAPRRVLSKVLGPAHCGTRAGDG
ncbi:amidohydrolase family protein [Amycolatopsis sp. NPDC005003]